MSAPSRRSACRRQSLVLKSSSIVGGTRSSTTAMWRAVRTCLQDVVPGPCGEHGGQERVVLADAEGGRLRLDQVGVAEDEALPEPCVGEEELSRHIAVEPMVEQHQLRLARRAARQLPHEQVARMRVAVHEATLEDLCAEGL
eukprot:5168288-Prymnesium_polylepis.1